MNMKNNQLDGTTMKLQLTAFLFIMFSTLAFSQDYTTSSTIYDLIVDCDKAPYLEGLYVNMAIRSPFRNNINSAAWYLRQDTAYVICYVGYTTWVLIEYNKIDSSDYQKMYVYAIATHSGGFDPPDGCWILFGGEYDLHTTAIVEAYNILLCNYNIKITDVSTTSFSKNTSAALPNHIYKSTENSLPSINGLYLNNALYGQAANINGTNWYIKDSSFALIYNSAFQEWEIIDYANYLCNDTVKASSCYYFNKTISLGPPLGSWGTNQPTLSSISADTTGWSADASGSDGGGWDVPVEFASFSASKINKKINLVWETVTEVNNYGFDIERRQVGSSNWAKIAFVQGNGTSNIEHTYSYTDKSVSSGSYIYRLKQIDNDGTYKYSQETEVTVETPGSYALNQNYPNPFNPSTVIRYSLPVTGAVSLKVYDVLGKTVATLVHETKEAGRYSVVWDASKLSSGTYFYKLISGTYTCTKKLLMIK
jgi:hypothetical protein